MISVHLMDPVPSTGPELLLFTSMSEYGHSPHHCVYLANITTNRKIRFPLWAPHGQLSHNSPLSAPSRVREAKCWTQEGNCRNCPLYIPWLWSGWFWSLKIEGRKVKRL